MLLGSQFNEIEVNRRKAETIQDVLAEFNDTHIQVMLLLVNIPSETLRQSGTLPWYGREYALDDVLVYIYYGHKRELSAQIAAFGDRLREQQEDTFVINLELPSPAYRRWRMSGRCLIPPLYGVA